jgi:uncharacterized protein (UPF0335 family)
MPGTDVPSAHAATIDPFEHLKAHIRDVEARARAEGYGAAMRVIILAVGQLDAENRVKLASALERLEDEAKKLAK